MARDKARYVCQSCGARHHRWQGWCSACNTANSIEEEQREASTPGGLRNTGAEGTVLTFASLAATEPEPGRLASGSTELDRVTGGGIVTGAAVLIGGDPGIGKSTLLLQVAANLARRSVPVLYVSGEEAVEQIGLRAMRLGLGDAPVDVVANTNLRDILASLRAAPELRVVIIDSIQTMFADTLESAPGTVAQVRTCTQELVRYAKRHGCTVILVGHVTKDGQLAGPRVLEHMVDTVLYFEGERSHQFRILRTVKNRFGPTDEIGVFEMGDGGLAEVANPSALFLGERSEPVSGSAVLAGIEGSRPILVEIQALVAQSPLGTPRRTVVGWDGGRLAMVLAVLDARCGMSMAGNDAYLNVAGGLRVVEPAADLAVAAALVSSWTDTALPAGTVLFGEISLSGEIRRVAHTEARLKEAVKLGFTRAIIPKGSRATQLQGMDITEVSSLLELVTQIGGDRTMTRSHRGLG